MLSYLFNIIISSIFTYLDWNIDTLYYMLTESVEIAVIREQKKNLLLKIGVLEEALRHDEKSASFLRNESEIQTRVILTLDRNLADVCFV